MSKAESLIQRIIESTSEAKLELTPQVVIRQAKLLRSMNMKFKDDMKALAAKYRLKSDQLGWAFWSRDGVYRNCINLNIEYTPADYKGDLNQIRLLHPKGMETYTSIAMFIQRVRVHVNLDTRSDPDDYNFDQKEFFVSKDSVARPLIKPLLSGDHSAVAAYQKFLNSTYKSAADAIAKAAREYSL